MSQLLVSYIIAANATPADVASLLDRINADFKIQPGQFISPQVVASAQQQSTEEDEGPSSDATVDKNGLPWDARIHSSKKSLNKDGTWRYLKGLQDTTKLAVEAELKAMLSNTGTVAVAAPEPVPVIAAPVNPTPAVTLNVTSPVIAAPVNPYTKLVDWLARNTAPSNVVGQQLNPDWVEQQFVANNITGGVAALANNFPMCDAFLEAFTSVITGAGLQPR